MRSLGFCRRSPGCWQEAVPRQVDGGCAAKNNSWEPVENLADYRDELVAYHQRKEKANTEHLATITAKKAARDAAKAGSSAEGEADAMVEVKVEGRSRRTARCCVSQNLVERHDLCPFRDFGIPTRRQRSYGWGG